ncbi:hypothetical protein V6U90_08000 [Micromonospora sp. CPCC 206060]|uniref:hypothetical protein n=1 Tax=Micromonospora sp. CPCC 206060 TaxID=3122406 RepID=UPI002FF40679
MKKLRPYAKATVGALVAGLTALGTALADNQVTPVEWIAVALAALAALGTLGVVYAVPNRTAGR